MQVFELLSLEEKQFERRHILSIVLSLGFFHVTKIKYTNKILRKCISQIYAKMSSINSKDYFRYLILFKFIFKAICVYFLYGKKQFRFFNFLKHTNTYKYKISRNELVTINYYVA